MKNEKFLWNSDRTKVVKVELIRNFSIEPTREGVAVLGWFNDKESINFGNFPDVHTGRVFLERILDFVGGMTNE